MKKAFINLTKIAKLIQVWMAYYFVKTHTLWTMVLTHKFKVSFKGHVVTTTWLQPPPI